MKLSSKEVMEKSLASNRSRVRLIREIYDIPGFSKIRNNYRMLRFQGRAQGVFVFRGTTCQFYLSILS